MTAPVMKTLRVSLVDLGLIPIGPGHSAYGNVWAKLTNQVRTTDGLVIVPSPTVQELPSSGIVTFQVPANDDPGINSADRGFGITVGWDLKVSTSPATISNLGTTILVTSSDPSIVSFGLKLPGVASVPLVGLDQFALKTENTSIIESPPGSGLFVPSVTSNQAAVDSVVSITVADAASATRTALNASYGRFINHGVDASTSRGGSGGMVTWTGSVRPNNMVDGDWWLETAQTAPNHIAGLQLWLKADALALNDADPVSTWNDSSGNGYNFTGTLTTRPLYKAAILNGKPVVRFDGSNDLLTRSYTDNLATAQMTMIWTVVTRGGAGAYRGLGNNTFATADRRGWALYANDSNVYQWWLGEHMTGASWTKLGTSATTVGTARILSITRGSSISAAYKDGTADGTSGVEYDPVLPANPATFLIGDAAASPTFPYNGDIAEIIIYSRALTTTELNVVHRYLGTKYGISVP